MNMTKQERKLKTALSLQRELNELHAAERAAKPEPLDRPIRSGWKRFFVIKPEHQHRADIRELQSLIDRLNTVVVCRNRDFKHKDARTRKLVDKPQFLRAIDQEELEQLEPRYQRMFVVCKNCKLPTVLFQGKCHWNRTHYHFDCYRLLEFRVKPNYLTHVHVVNSLQVSRIQQIHNKMTNHRYWDVLNHHSGNSYRWGDDHRTEDAKTIVAQELRDLQKD
jgi:hypothetical protein